MKTIEFQKKVFKETGRFFKIQHLYYLERAGVFSVPRTPTGRREFKEVYKEVYRSIMEYYTRKYGWLGITKGELQNDTE